MKREQSAARILVVEDQEDVRRLLVTALQIEGHEVDEASNAHDGLKKLSEHRYRLVLSDYAMPGGTGTWMLNEAARLGWMRDAVALILTAHAEARELSAVDVIPKPFDLDTFLTQVRTVLADVHDADSGGTAPGGHRIELVLYVSSASSASLQARRNLEKVLQEFEPSQIQLSVRDLEQDPFAGDRDRVAFTPTLVKRYPEPPMWILGNLKEREVITDLLVACGVQTKAKA
jgi:DNA-binding NtrC family response regulator